MYIIGVDPGLRGGVATLGHGGEVLHLEDMPIRKIDRTHEIVVKELYNMLNRYDPSELRVFVEKVHSMPFTKPQAVWTFALAYGAILHILEMLEIPHTKVLPQTWQKVMMRDMVVSKVNSIHRARELFPASVIGKKDGLAEALLIAEYGRRLGHVQIL